MKHESLILLAFFFYGPLVANAQASDIEKEIRRLEKAQCDAIVQHDTVALYKIWSRDFTVNSPTNDVVKLEAAKFAIRNGFIDYSLLERHMENIMIFKDIVISMGGERIKP